MKTLQINAQITGIRSKVDRSLGLSISTPEFTPEETAELLRLQGLNVELTITPMDEKPTDTMVIDREAGEKTPSERLRAIIYRLWETKKDKWPEHQMFYRHTMEKIIEQIKDKL